MKVNSRKDGENLIIELILDAHDQLCLNHDLLDIVDWYAKGPSSEKIHSCRKRMIQENKDKLMASKEMASKTMAEVSVMMVDPVVLCESISKMEGYKNRKQREAIQ